MEYWIEHTCIKDGPPKPIIGSGQQKTTARYYHLIAAAVAALLLDHFM